MLCPYSKGLVPQSWNTLNISMDGDDILPLFDNGNSVMAKEAFNSLTAIGGPDRQLFFELRARVVSPRIFVRSQSLIAR